MLQVRLRTKARSDLFEIESYTRKHWGEVQVKEIELIINRAVNSIVATPYLGRKTQSENVFVKTLIDAPFIIVYQVGTESIFITRILHTKRNR